MPKRSRASAAVPAAEDITPPSKRTPIPLPPTNGLKRRSSARNANNASTDPDINGEVIDAPTALRASPDSAVNGKIAPAMGGEEALHSLLSDAPDTSPRPKKRGKANKNAATTEQALETPKKNASKAKGVGEELPVSDPEAEDEEVADEEEVQKAVSRPPPVHSDYLPLPWKGRLGYACLNTYLRNATPPVFSSRTCRIASIIDHRHPLKDPSQPEHATKNRPDKEQPAEVRRGQEFVESLGLANARDIIKMVRWNEKYGIKFLRLSSEMFPFASHEEYGYKLAPFAAETLAEAGKVIAELGHRVTTHPGQFTQLGSPRKSVIDNAFRDLEYHDEMLSLLKLPPQQDRDAVMILHMGGTFGDKPATLDRFRENYAKLSPSVKNRLVLENDDVSWTVHDLLPVCQELNIPLVLDFHHHNILFDADKLREGTRDIMDLYPQITATWTRKGIRQKMHYSEPTPAAITPMQRRKHNPRPFTLPPCANDMDLMIEAKDKEQAVFELMRNFKLPGWDLFNDIIPHVRQDENKPVRAAASKKAMPKKKKGLKKNVNGDDILEAAAEDLEDAALPLVVPEDEVGMGGPERRVYWPPGMEEWLRPAKRGVKKNDEGKLTPAQKKKIAAEVAAADAATAPKKEGDGEEEEEVVGTRKKKQAPKRAQSGRPKKAVKSVPTPSTSDGEDEDVNMPKLDGDEEEGEVDVGNAKGTKQAARKSGRVGRTRVSYKEEMSD
ncbi:UV damage endonuclease uvsE [Macrophomina phaseolina]|uniref:UV damage endonuclease uvsE n=1 Tax=Macrophomina phaseolina TaxID=35725 RepID=A0ABQ8GUY9_9PEZI|nr:UV damage endonuclease uvsE [Macrophomina phaseolina]